MANLFLLVCIPVAIFLSATTTHATYIVDSTNVQNPATRYLHRNAPPGVPHPWFYYPPEAGLIDSQRLYAGNCTSSWCVTDNGCRMIIDFTGTGLTMYAAMIWSFTFNASLDGKPLQTQTFDGVSGCCNDAIQPLYNFTFYDVQSLPYGSHSLAIYLLDSTSGYRPSNGDPRVSVLMFDYAVVNDTNSNPTSVPTSAPSSTAVSPTSHEPSVPIGPVIGGAIGGVAIILALLFVIFCNRKRSRTQKSLDDAGPRIPASSNHPTTNVVKGVPHITDYLPRGIDAGPVIGPIVGRSQSQMSTAAKRMPAIAHVPPTGFEPPISPPSSPKPNSTTSLVAMTQRPVSSTSGSVITGQDGQLFNQMNNLNITVAEVAAAVEVIRAEREAANRTSSSSRAIRREPDTDPGDNPPGYDY